MAIEHPLSSELRRRAHTVRAVGAPLIVGIAGGVAVGKSTFASSLCDASRAWPEQPEVEAIATDGFLFPNAVLAERNISLRKGFPESYDVAAMRDALIEVRAGQRVALPRYSHVTYDVDPNDPLTVEKPNLLILDGLHLAQIERLDHPRLIDVLIYLDAEDGVIEKWFTARLIPLMLAGRDDPNSFYYRFRDWDDAQRANFAKYVWDNINLPNLRDHIVKDRDAAHIVVSKNADHSIAAIEYRS
jgi:type I pantothenate kinase